MSRIFVMGSINEGADGRVYLVDYEEDLWLSYDDDSKQHCIDTWMKKAAPLKVAFFALRLRPDTLFPSTEHETPYIALSLPVTHKDPSNAFRVKTVAIAQIEPDIWHNMDDGLRQKTRDMAKAAARTAGADAWLVRIGGMGGGVLDQGGRG